MDYKYHVQLKAAEIADEFHATPMNYPLHKGLSDNFRERFADFRDIMKRMYKDMAVRPKDYGLKLVDISFQSSNDAAKGLNTINRLCNTLPALFESGCLEDNHLIVSADEFKKKIKERKITKYELMLARLTDFGFDFSEFDGKPFGNNVGTFTVAYPDAPGMIDTLYQYFVVSRKAPNSWHGGRGDLFLHVHAVDYGKTPKWLAQRNYLIESGFQEETIKFFDAFFECSLRYKDIYFEVSYNNSAHAKGCRYYYKSTQLAYVKKDWDGDTLYLNLKDRNTFDSLDPSMAAEYWKMLALEHNLTESDETEREMRRNQPDEYMAVAHAHYDYFQAKGYKDVKCVNGTNYYLNDGTRTAWGFSASHKWFLILSNVLKNIDKYEQEILAMPEGVISKFKIARHRACSGHSGHCGGKLPNFTFAGEEYPSACCYGLNIDVFDTDLTLIPYFWRLLEMEYGLEK